MVGNDIVLERVKWENEADRVSAEAVEYLSVILHEECPEVDDRPSEEPLQDELVVVLCFREDLYNSILEEEQSGGVVTRFLKDGPLCELFSFQVVDQIMEGVI